MKVLLIWRDIPSPTHPSLARPFYLSKFNKKYELTLLSFFTKKSVKSSIGLYDRVELVKIPTLKDIYRPYFPEMLGKTISLLQLNRFDIIYADYMMHSYLLNAKIPVILEFFSPTLFSLKQLYQREKSFMKKIRFLIRYYSFSFEALRYKKFDAGIYVTQRHKELSKPFVPKKAFVIPPGVDLEYFKPSRDLSNFPMLVFTGSMNYPINIHSVIHFCKEIYPMIKKEIPNVRFYIVGRSPVKEIKKLSVRDNSIVVTGEVEDIRSYIGKAHIAIVPIVVDDGGIKTKVLEAMAMGKAVVSTSLGVQGIGTTHGKNVIIADDLREFANHVINLLGDENERRRLGKNARKFVEEEYSWQKMTEMLIDAFKDVVTCS